MATARITAKAICSRNARATHRPASTSTSARARMAVLLGPLSLVIAPPERFAAAAGSRKGWRRGWDSNARSACTHGGFQDRCRSLIRASAFDPLRTLARVVASQSLLCNSSGHGTALANPAVAAGHCSIRLDCSRSPCSARPKRRLSLLACLEPATYHLGTLVGSSRSGCLLRISSRMGAARLPTRADHLRRSDNGRSGAATRAWAAPACASLWRRGRGLLRYTHWRA